MRQYAGGADLPVNLGGYVRATWVSPTCTPELGPSLAIPR
jgi:hypothetical protein